MNVKEQLDDKYKMLVAKLGDLEFRKHEIERQISKIKEDVLALSKVAPLLEDVVHEPKKEEE